jgi:hypothetical protein
VSPEFKPQYHQKSHRQLTKVKENSKKQMNKIKKIMQVSKEEFKKMQKT